MAMYVSWINKVREWAGKGISVPGGVNIKFRPIMDGKIFKRRPCPKCNAKGGVVFRNEDKSAYAVFCQKCGKYTVKLIKKGTTITAPAGDSSWCKAITKKGTRCHNKAKENGLCGIHHNSANTPDPQVGHRTNLF